MTLLECINAYRSFKELASLQLPLMSSFAIAQNISLLEPAVKAFEDTRAKYQLQVNQAAYKDESGNTVVDDEVGAQYNKDMQELLDSEQSIKLKKVTVVVKPDMEIEPQKLLGCVNYVTFKANAN